MRKFTIAAALAIFAAVAAGCTKSDGADAWNDPVIPVTLTGIEAVNIDNTGEYPEVSAEAVKKEAYVLGVRWVTDHVITENDKFITGPITEGSQNYGQLGLPYQKAIMCLTPFSAGIPAGTYVSKFFKEIDSRYLPVGVDEGFALLVAPDAGEHSFRVEYYDYAGALKFSYDTPTITLF
jgi:hypothetical protein